MLLLILFMYIFSFKIYSGLPFLLSSARLIYIGILPFYLINKEWQKESIKILKSKKVYTILCLLFSIILYIFFVSTAYSTYDYSILSPFINQIIAIIFGIIIFSLFKLKNKVKSIPKYLIYTFIIQSLIQFLSFASPSVRNLFNIFRSESSILVAEKYNYIRGLAISGGQFFSLGVGFGLVFILYSYFWDELFKRTSVLKYLSIIFLFFGAISAARTSLAGIFIAAFYYTINKLKKMNFKFNIKLKLNLINIFLVIVLTVIFVFAVYIVDLSFITDKIHNMSKFAFEFIYNFINEGELSTSSTDALFNRMYFKVSLKTFFIGDGVYTNPDGSYYMHTDAGYMRNILYFGIIGFIILFIYQLQFFDWRKKKYFFFNILVIIYILIMHIKGDTLSYNNMMQKILLLLLLYNMLNTKKELIKL